MTRDHELTKAFLALERTVLQMPGARWPPARLAVDPEDPGLPPPVRALATQISRRAVDVDDTKVAACREAGLDDDAIFEVAVVAAFGEARRRLTRARAALGWKGLDG